jgi:hypothetical protein
MRPHLTKGQVTAEDSEARSTERLGQREKKGSVAIRSRAVRQYDAIPAGTDGQVQKAANRYLLNSVQKLSTVVHTQDLISAKCICSLIEREKIDIDSFLRVEHMPWDAGQILSSLAIY